MTKDDDFKLLRGFDNELTDGRTFVIVESLSRLKKVHMGSGHIREEMPCLFNIAKFSELKECKESVIVPKSREQGRSDKIKV